MKDVIDLKGASGARYRFRVWPAGAPHLPIAGNYVVLREEPGGFSVLLVGETNDLSRSGSEAQRMEHPGASHVFTRLNVARSVRRAEHEDLVANYQAVQVSQGDS